MKKLLLWNLLLAVCATAGIYELRIQWIRSEEQQKAVLLRKPLPVKVETRAPEPKPNPFQATSYTDVAQKTLFAKDRNPNVVVEAPPAPPPPPPPPPMPDLPKLYGVLGLPSGAVAIMSEKSGGGQKKVRQGDSIGEFKVARLDPQRITLTWKDKTIDKAVDELLDRTVVATAAAAPTQALAGGQLGSTQLKAAEPVIPGDPRGIAIGDGIRACKGDDSTAPGAVFDGYKKSVEPTPFGNACRWLVAK